MWLEKREKKRVACSLSQSILFILLFLTYANSTLCAQTNHTIKGNIANIPSDASNIIHIYSYYGGELSEQASTPVNKQGDFKLEIKDTLQQGLYKIGVDKKNAASIVLSGEKNVKIKADFGQLKADNITVTNSRENEAYRALLNEWNSVSGKMVSLNIERSQISTVDPSFTRKTKAIDEKVRLVFREYNVNLMFIKETYPDTFTADVLVHTPEGLEDSVDSLLARAEVSSEVYDFTIQYLIDTFQAKGLTELAEYVMDMYEEGCGKPLSERTADKIKSLKRLRVGQIAPEIISQNPDGEAIAMSSLKGKNVLMVYFWASWCASCEAENPNIVRIYNKYKERGFDIYALSLDRDKAEWLKAINKHKFTWTNVSDLQEWESEAVTTYNVNRTPTIYLLNSEGRIMAKDLRGKELEMKLNELLN